MKLTAQEEIYLRQRPHKTKLWLSVYQPQTVFQTQLASGTFQFGETDIDYTGTITGSWMNTYPNMTVLVGSSPGESDVGRVRLRSATGTYVVVAENNIYWNQNQYLTFIDYIDVEAVFPRIIKDPDDDENVIFYKDDDIPYSNQNSLYGTFPCAGSHRAAFIETGTARLYWTATGTSNVRDDSITYDWHFEGGSPTGSTALTPGYVSYDTAGHYKTRLITTSSSGVKDYTYRYVSIYDRPENGTNNPILKWNLNDLSGSRGEGGYIANIRVWQNLSQIEPNALVVIFADDEYGSTTTSLGGNGQNNQKIVFVGYVLRDSIQFNYKDGWAEFDVGSISEVMKSAEGFAVSCESKASPATWYQLWEMNVPKALYHYLRWHSTVLNVNDFQYTGDARLVQYFDTDRGSLYDAISTFVSEGLIGEVVTDRQGKLWAEITPVGYQNPIDSIADGMTIQKMDWIGEPNVSIRRTAEVSFVEMGGIVFEGVATNGFQALLSNSPSSTPLYRGKTDGSKQGLILTSQTQLNRIAGNYLAKKNSRYEDVTLSLAGNYRNFDIAPQEKLYLMFDGSETPMGESLIGKPFRLMSMNWTYNSERDTFYPDVAFEQIATGTAGETIIIPAFTDDTGFSFPEFNLPPLPDFNTGYYTPPVQQETQYLLGLEGQSGDLFYTTSFDQANPEWIRWMYGIDTANDTVLFNDVHMFFIAPNGAVWTISRKKAGVYSFQFRELYRAPYLGGKFEKIITEQWLDDYYGAGSQYEIVGLGFNVDKAEEIAFIVSNYTGGSGEKTMWIGNSAGWTKGVSFTAVTRLFGKISGNNNGWVWDEIYAGNEGWTALEPGGKKISSELFGQGSANNHWRAGNSNIVVKWKEGITGDEGILRSEDNGINIDVIANAEGLFGKPNNLQSDPSGQYLMGNYKNGVHRGRSYDGGYSWSVLTGLVPVGTNTIFCYCGGEGTSSKWVAAYGAVYYSSDFGSSWSDKTGNLLQVFLPPGGAQILRFVSYLPTSEL